MALTYNKINDWVLNEVKAANLSSDQFVVALSNVAPGAESTPPTGDGAGILANVTQIAYTNLSTRNLTLESGSPSQVAGTFKLDFVNLVLTASGGDVAAFRYIYIYDDTVSGDPLVAYFDNGSAITITNGSSKTLQFHANGLYTKS